MNLKHLPDLNQLLSTTIFDADLGTEQDVVKNYLKNASSDLQRRLIAQLKDAISQTDFSVEELGTVSNRWFGEEEEARQWLGELLGYLQSGEASDGAAPVKVLDSNGAELQEGDSVLTIKDLKVKGGSSDLKRGTLIKKIHLIDDAENIECRVDGSTLVLKTCFLKKA
jgi:protein PhnA